MIKYKLKENAIAPNALHPMESYLRSLGIDKPQSFMVAPSKDDELSPFLLDNIERCIQELYKGFKSNKKFFLQVDSDVDGITSSSIFYRFFKGYYPEANIVWRLHEGKEHGVIIDTVPDDADIIVLPDSGSMQLEEQQELADKGKIIIIIDHHTVTDRLDNDNVILVNNQVSDRFSNKSLSGAGMVLKVIQAYAHEHPDLYTKPQDFYDLAALGIISDMMDMRDLDNNYIVYCGLKNIKSLMFQALLNKQSYSIKDVSYPTKIDVAFYIAPLINGVIRAGTAEEKRDLFLGFIEEPPQDSVDTTYRGQDRHETFYEYAARTAYNIKNRQNTVKEKCYNFLRQKIDEEGLNKNQVIVVIASKDDKVVVPQNITGLIAMELLKNYGKPVLVLRPKMENGELVYAGSGRGKIAEGFSSFLQLVRNSEYSEYGEGHDMAFGAAIPAKDIDKFIEECNEKLHDVNFSNEFIEVDAIFNYSNINHQMLYEFAAYDRIYGNSIPQPKIAITGIYHKEDLTLMGKDKSTIKVKVGQLPCIKFKDSELANALQGYNSGKMVLIGRPQLNYWMGNETVQLFIDEIEVEPIAAKSLF